MASFLLKKDTDRGGAPVAFWLKTVVDSLAALAQFQERDIQLLLPTLRD